MNQKSELILFIGMLTFAFFLAISWIPPVGGGPGNIMGFTFAFFVILFAFIYDKYIAEKQTTETKKEVSK